MSSKNFLICLAGLPASGKTTFANNLKGFIEENMSSMTVKIIDPDIIRNSLTSGAFDPDKEQLVRQNNLKEIENALVEGHIVISDDLNYYSSMRHDLKNICDKLNVFLFIIYIATPLEVCLKRNILRGKPIPNEVIKEIHKRFDNFDKYQWDQPTITIDQSKVQKFNKIAEHLMKKINLAHKISSFKGKSKKSISSETKYRQELDSITREIVREILEDPTLHSISKKISKFRKLFLKQYSKAQVESAEISKLFRKFLNENLNT